LPKDKLNKDETTAELIKYHDLILATIDYYIRNQVMKIKTDDFDSDGHYQNLKLQAGEHFQKGRLAKLKQWFRDLTEPQIESGDLKFNRYLRDKTNYDIDIFKSFFKRVDEKIAKGKITTANQFYDIKIMVDHLLQTEPADTERIEILNRLLRGYEEKKSAGR
jgi:hypothetical protein